MILTKSAQTVAGVGFAKPPSGLKSFIGGTNRITKSRTFRIRPGGSMAKPKQAQTATTPRTHNRNPPAAKTFSFASKGKAFPNKRTNNSVNRQVPTETAPSVRKKVLAFGLRGGGSGSGRLGRPSAVASRGNAVARDSTGKRSRSRAPGRTRLRSTPNSPTSVRRRR